jgi:tetratricopeptide (TPR) repeat protein
MAMNNGKDEGPHPEQGAGDSLEPVSFGAPLHTGSGDINQAGRDINVYPPPPPGLPVPQQLPRDIGDFTGRTEHLATLDAVLVARVPILEPISIASVTGLAGTGKTALAVHWAHQVRDRFPDGQLYVNLRGFSPSPALEPTDVLAQFIGALDVPREKIPRGLDEQKGLFRSLLAGRRMLILLDNAAAPDQVRPLVPNAANCLVLVTSRSSLDGLVALDSARPIMLGVMTPPESVALLSKVIGLDRVRDMPQAADELARFCAHLPLALRLAAVRAARDDESSLTELVEELSDTRRRLDLMATDDDPDAAVRVVFSWSYGKLPTNDARMFRRLGLHAGAEPSVAAAAVLADVTPAVARQALDRLAGVHLVERLGRGRYEMLDLLRIYAAERAEKEESNQQLIQAIERGLTWYLRTAASADELLFPQRRHIQLEEPAWACPAVPFNSPEEALAWCEAERANLTAAIEQATSTGHDAIAWKLAVALGGFFNLRTHWADWVKTHEVGLRAAQRIPDPFGEAWILNNLGNAYHNFQQPTQSLDCYERALRIRRRIGDLQGEAISLMNRGSAYELRKQFDDSLRDFDGALDIFKKLGDRYGLGMALSNIANVCRQLGQTEKALEYSQSALELRRVVKDRQGEAFTLSNIAQIYAHLGDYEQAFQNFEDSLAIRREVGDLQGEAGTLLRWGFAYKDIGQLDATRARWQEALAIFESIGDPQADELRPLLENLDDAETSQAAD